MSKFAANISTWLRPYRNKKRQKYYLKKLGDVKENYIIISNNCIGGMCYHDINKEFLSPTINCYIHNFLTFAPHFEEYLACDLKEDVESKKDCPVGILGGNSSLPFIQIDFVHYSSFAEANKKWKERSTRMSSSKGKTCIIYCVPLNMNLCKKEVDDFMK